MMKRSLIFIAMFLVGGCITVCRTADPDWLCAVQDDYASRGVLTVEADANEQYFIGGRSISLSDMCDIQERARLPSDAKVILAARPGATPADVKRARVCLRWQFSNLVVTPGGTPPGIWPTRD